MLYTVYKTINTVNNKEYVGFHKINDIEDILCTESENGSIFKDGYLGSGKLMKRALEKYGPLNMKQELILVTEDKEEAEELEKEIVNIEWVESSDNYNLSIGGNVAILFGEQNGFFGKNHSKETIDKIQKSRSKTLIDSKFTWSEMTNIKNEVFFNRQDVIDFYKIEGDSWQDIKHQINSMVYNGELTYKSQYLQERALSSYHKREKMLSLKEQTTKKRSEECSERFKGVPKTKESNIKRGKSISKWIEDNPEKHTERMLKINKNPEKIKRMVEKQLGKIWITNKESGKNTRHDPSLPIPEGWRRGFNKKK